MKQSLEHNDQILTGTLYAHLADAYVGIAGTDDPETANGSRSRAKNMSRAEVYIDRSRDCTWLSPFQHFSYYFQTLANNWQVSKRPKMWTASANSS